MVMYTRMLVSLGGGEEKWREVTSGDLNVEA